ATVPIFSMFSEAMISDTESAVLDPHYFTDAFLVIMYRWLSQETDQSPEEFIESLKNVLVKVGKDIVRSENS
ncbi:MAG: hypothetical protein SPE66_01300, partial [Bilifractor sp.]|nr:hypothetical protein [Bilifractor sp.]